jgi:hypothetical protein
MFPGERGLLVTALPSMDCVVPILLRCYADHPANEKPPIRNKCPCISHPIRPLPLSSTVGSRTQGYFLVRQPGVTDSEMAQNGTRPAKNGTTILLYTGNIMTDGGRGGFLNTTMSKNNAEVCVLFWAVLTVSW